MNKIFLSILLFLMGFIAAYADEKKEDCNPKEAEVQLEKFLSKLPSGYVKGKGNKISGGLRYRYYLPGYDLSKGDLSKSPVNKDTINENESQNLEIKELIACVDIYENGQIFRIVPYKDGYIDGISYSWHANGQAGYILKYVKGLLDGRCLHWDKEGNTIGDYVMDMGTGTVKTFFTGGMVRMIESFKNGKKDGLCKRFYSNGEVQCAARYKNGLIAGITIFCHKNGEIDFFSMYTEDCVQHGLALYISSKGKVTSAYYIINGKKVSKDEYIEASQKDPSLPKYEEDIQKYKEAIKIPQEYMKKEPREEG